MSSRAKSFFAQLTRRKVVRIAVAYAVAMWVLLEVSATLFDLLSLPVWAGRALVAVLALGLPVAVILAWVFDITPEGIVVTERDDAASTSASGISGSVASDAARPVPAPPDARDERNTNLTARLAPLLGREQERDALCALLRRDDTRLVTLTGPGGTGKTSLALQVAADLMEDFASGAWVVFLQSIREPGLLLPTIAQTLGVSEAAGQSLSAWLAPKRLLLVLDNFEQIVDAAPVLGDLLAHAPQLKLIATSRELLHIAGERVFPVPPLALPDPRRVGNPEDLAQFASAALFVERAQAAHPGFALTPRNAAEVAELCVRLDGLPLAIELAAARVSLLSPGTMLKRLGERLSLLTAGARDAPQRQQTLRNTLVWSHELLTPAERTLFARLAVFVGGFTLEAAEAVCDAGMDTLAALVDRSMVRREDERFDMLETIGAFALESFAAGSESEAVRERHATYFVAMAERAYELRWHDDKAGLDALAREHDNLRAALDFLHAADPRRELALAGALGWFWHLRSHFSEGRARLAQALGAVPGPDHSRARALAAAGEIAAWSGDLNSARPLIEEAVALWRARGETQEIAGALIELGWGCFNRGDADAQGLMEEGLKLRQQHGDPLLENRARLGLLQVLVSLGQLDVVEPMAREALAVSRRTGDLRSEHLAHHFLADCSLMRGDCAAALPQYRRALALAMELGDRSETAVELQGVAMSLAGCGQHALALRLAGATEAEFEAIAIDLSGIVFWSELLDRQLGIARNALGPEAAAAAQEGGRRTPIPQAIALATAYGPEPGA